MAVVVFYILGNWSFAHNNYLSGKSNFLSLIKLNLSKTLKWKRYRNSLKS